MIEVSVEDRNGSRAAYRVRPGERLLHAGLQAGLGLPYECATGTCGSCKATVVSGAAEWLWPEAPGRKSCRRPGEILTCQSEAVEGPLALKVSSAFRAVGEPACAARKGRLSAFRPLTDEVGIVSVELDGPFDHLPGQFALISAPGIAGPRAYSMTSAPCGGSSLDFLVRLSDRGGLTPHLFSNAFEGREVDLFGPLGRAVLRPNEERPFLAIAGGSGVAGLLSVLDAALERGLPERHPSRLVFGLRSPRSSYLLDRLAGALRRGAGGLGVSVAFSEEPAGPELREAFPELRFETGLVHEVARSALAEMAGANPICFVAGPPAMADAAMRMLVIEGKVSPAEIRLDRFG